MSFSNTPPMADLRAALRQTQLRRQWRAFALTLPLLLFLLLTLLLPIAALLLRAIENPEVANALPHTVAVLKHWDRQSPPDAPAYAALVRDLSGLTDNAAAGALARRLNSEAPGARSLIMGTWRALPIHGEANAVRQQLLKQDPRWAKLEFWQVIAKNGQRWTPDYLLASLDLKRDSQGHIERMPANERAYGLVLARTFGISLVVTFVCLLLAYPLAWWLANLPKRSANLLMIIVLVPFWTSILVRVAAWIVLLQSRGLVNTALLDLGLISQPLPLLFNRAGVIIAMTHILLPFMILPLYSVMQSVPPSYMRAAISLGSAPLAAFARVYLPQTLPGVGAGCLLVFILALGYYITPALLGGASDQMLSYYIARYANVDLNWGLACALSAVLLGASMLLYGVYRRISKTDLTLA